MGQVSGGYFSTLSRGYWEQREGKGVSLDRRGPFEESEESLTERSWRWCQIPGGWGRSLSHMKVYLSLQRETQVKDVLSPGVSREFVQQYKRPVWMPVRLALPRSARHRTVLLPYPCSPSAPGTCEETFRKWRERAGERRPTGCSLYPTQEAELQDQAWLLQKAGHFNFWHFCLEILLATSDRKDKICSKFHLGAEQKLSP